MTLVLLFLPASLTAQTSLAALFQVGGDLPGWSLVEEPKQYRGDELFLMIDGGADIYHEYGFSKVMAGEYINEAGNYIRLEVYEMASAEAAYGIYTFKRGTDGKDLDIGQAAFLEEYYLNFWKGNLLVTIVGSDSDPLTIEAVVTLGKYLDNHYLRQGERPKLATLLLGEPVAFSQPRYIRGSIGAMNSYVFDTEDIFQVHEGMVGTVAENQIFVFRYVDDNTSRQIFTEAASRFATSHRFDDISRKGNLCSMVDRDHKVIFMTRAGQDIVTVIGQNRDKVATLAEELVEKINGF